MKGIRVTVALSLALALGCKGKTQKAEDKQPAVDEQEEQRGGHLRLPSNEPRFLNPILETRFNRASILLFEGLVGLDAKLEPIPRLAESWEESESGKVLTFRLRRGVTWSDGKPFSAADVAFTMNAIKTTGAPSLWKAYFAAVDSWETPDDHTVVVRYAKPYSPALMSFTVGILPAHAFDDPEIIGSKANSEPITTGPYKLQRWEAGKSMLLAANESWWSERPKIDTIELVFHISDPLAALENDEIDFANIPDVGSWASRAQLPEFREKHESTTEVEPIFRVIAWNNARAPFSDTRVRQALTHALDRQRVVEDVLLGQARALSGPFFPNMAGADPSISPRVFDLDRAIKLLDEAGHPSKNGARFAFELITLHSQRIPVNEEMFAIFRRDLGSIGIDLKVVFMSAEEFETRVIKGDYDAAFFGWLRDIPDPDPSALLHSTQIGSQNFAQYKNPAVDTLLEEAVATANRDERKAIYHRVHAKVHEDMPYTVLYAPLSHYAWSRRLRGVNPADIGPQTRFPGLSRWYFVKP